MTDKTEMLIKETLRRQADRAPDAMGLLTALEARPVRTRPRRAVLVGVTAAAAVLLAGGAVLVAGPGGSSDRTTPAATPPHGTLLQWEPHWVPAGMTEKTRMVAANGSTRIWTDTPVDQTGNTKGPKISLDTTRGSATTFGSGGGAGMSPTRVDINGVTGWLTVLDQKTKDVMVGWQPRPGTALSVRVMGLADGSGTALRVARSVRPDGTDRFAPLISFADLPENWGRGGYVTRVYGNSPQEAQTELTVFRDVPNDFHGAMTLYAFTLLPGKPIPTPVDGASEPTVFAIPAPGVRVALRPDLRPDHNPKIDNAADVARIAKLIHADPDADVSWIGTP